MVRRFLLLPQSALVATALAVVYVVWGSTYLAIRVGLEAFPPFLLGGTRFLIAGAILYALTARRLPAAERPTWRQWASSAAVGGLLLVGGNGAVTWAEQYIPSGIAALLVATVALWMPLIGWLMYRERLSIRAGVGLLAGFAGVAILVQPGGAGAFDVLGTLAVLGAALSWAFGSLLSRRLQLPPRPLVATAMEMLSGGAMFAVLSLVTGELSAFDPSQVTARAAGALAYLVVFGSLLAFSAYVWLLRNADTAVVSTYAYVNPAVAVVLGWWLLAEPLTPRTIIAGTVIVGSVALIVTARGAAARSNDEDMVADEAPVEVEAASR